MMDMDKLERKQLLYYLYKQKEVIINVNYFLRARLKKKLAITGEILWMW